MIKDLDIASYILCCIFVLIVSLGIGSAIGEMAHFKEWFTELLCGSIAALLFLILLD